MRYYAVHKGFRQGIFTTWDECQAVTRNTKGAIFKKFERLDEAHFFMMCGYDPNSNVIVKTIYDAWVANGKQYYVTREYVTEALKSNEDEKHNSNEEALSFSGNSDNSGKEQERRSLEEVEVYMSPKPKANEVNSIENILDDVYRDYKKTLPGNKYITTKHYIHSDIAYAYVDGSYRQDKTASHGVVIFHNGNVVTRNGRESSHDLDMSARNIIGEIHGAELALKYCEDNSVKNLVLHFDYKGIGCWATKKPTPQYGEDIKPWKAKTPLTIKYQERMRNTNVNILPKKVKAHSGHVYNDIADQLATSANTSMSKSEFKYVTDIPFNV